MGVKPDQGKPNLLFVLGMHRGGTSALANVLAHVGFDFGDKLLEAGEENPKGFFENPDIITLHDTLLNKLGRSWMDTRAMPSNWLHDNACVNSKQSLSIIINRSTNNNSIFAVKDPRLCRLLPFWLDVCAQHNISTASVIVLRHPLEVAASLHKRNKLLPPTSLQLYSIYIAEALSNTQDIPRAIVFYDDILARPEQTARSVLQQLSINYFGLWDDKYLGIDHNLYRNRIADINYPTPFLAGYQQTLLLYQQYKQGVADQARNPSLTHYYEIPYISGKHEIGKIKTAPLCLFVIPASLTYQEANDLLHKHIQNIGTESIILLSDSVDEYSVTPLITELIEAALLVFQYKYKNNEIHNFIKKYTNRDQILIAGRIDIDSKYLIDFINSCPEINANHNDIPCSNTQEHCVNANKYHAGKSINPWVKYQEDEAAGIALSYGLNSKPADELFFSTFPDISKYHKYTVAHNLNKHDLDYSLEYGHKINTIANNNKSSTKKHSFTILLPIHDAYEQTISCINSVLANTDTNQPIFLLDDGSADIRLVEELNRIFRDNPNIRLLCSESNLGFVKTVNRGIFACEEDVLVLNSDTIVTRGWTEKLTQCLNSDERIGIVCPLSNNATLLSLPDINQEFPISEANEIEIISLLTERSSERRYPRIPVAVGFCMLIRRELLSQVGVFDEVYGFGYGEECDLSIRTWQAGYEIACADDTFIYHKGQASFSQSDQKYFAKQNNSNILHQRFPFYPTAIRTYCEKNPLRDIGERIHSLKAFAEGDTRLRLLIVMHRYHTLGGVEAHVQDIVGELKYKYRITILYLGQHNGEWTDLKRFVDHREIEIAIFNSISITPHRIIKDFAADIDDPAATSFFSQFVAHGHWDIIHFHHLAGWNNLQLPIIAKQAGANVVFSLHDMHLLCPDYNQLDSNDNYCGQLFADGKNNLCCSCISSKQSSAYLVSKQTPKYLKERYDAVIAALDACALLLFPSAYLLERFLASFNISLWEKSSVLSHGLLLEQSRSERPIKPRLNIAFIGTFCAGKGADVFLSLIRGSDPTMFSFHIFGAIDSQYADDLLNTEAIVHRSYNRKDLPGLLKDVDIAVIPSRFPESFCLTLSECQYLGIPVIASRIGAIPERVTHNETGFLIPPGDAEALIKLLNELHGNQTRLQRVRRKLQYIPHTSIVTNAAGYDKLYRKLVIASKNCSAHRNVCALNGSTFVKKLLGVNDQQIAGISLGTKIYAQYIEKAESTGNHKASTPVKNLFVIFGHEHSYREIEQTIESIDSALDSPSSILLLTNKTYNNKYQQEKINLTQLVTPEYRATLVNQKVAALDSEWICYMDSGDTLFSANWQKVLNTQTTQDSLHCIYGDWDLKSATNERYAPRFLPDFNIELLRSAPHLIRNLIIRKDTWHHIGGFSFSSQLIPSDLLFRVQEIFGTEGILHIHGVLCHRLDKNEQQYSNLQGKGVVERHLLRLNLPTTVIAMKEESTLYVRHKMKYVPSVSIILSTWNNQNILQHCLNNIIQNTNDIPLQLIVVAFNSIFSQNPPDLNALKRHFALGIIWLQGLEDRPFRSLNHAASYASSDYFLFLESSLEVISTDWLHRLLDPFQQSDVAAVGSKTIFPTGKVAGGALILGAGLDGIGKLMESRASPAWATAFPSIRGRSDVSSLTPDCLMVRKTDFEAEGGFNSDVYPSHYAMIDLSLKWGRKNKRLIYDSLVLLRVVQGIPYSYKTMNHSPGKTEQETAELFEQWLPELAIDPLYNPELSLQNIGEPELLLREKYWDDDMKQPYIGAYDFDNWGIGEYRVRAPMSALQAWNKFRTVLFDANTPILPTPAEIERSGIDILYLHNALHDNQLRRIAQYRYFNEIPVVFGQDDLLFDLPDYNPYKQTNYKDIKKRIHTALGFADRLIVTTKPLYESYNAVDIETLIIPNTIDRKKWEDFIPRLDIDTHFSSKPRVGWAGAAQHSGDLEILMPVIEKLHKQIEWVFLGDCPAPLRQYAAEVHPMVSIDDYPGKLASLKLNLALAPLQINPFNEAKSNIKILEYGILGYPVICTNILPYQTAPVHLVSNKTESWVNAIEEHLAEPVALREKGMILQKWVLDHWMLDQHLEKWERAFDF